MSSINVKLGGIFFNVMSVNLGEMLQLFGPIDICSIAIVPFLCCFNFSLLGHIQSCSLSAVVPLSDSLRHCILPFRVLLRDLKPQNLVIDCRTTLIHSHLQTLDWSEHLVFLLGHLI